MSILGLRRRAVTACPTSWLSGPRRLAHRPSTPSSSYIPPYSPTIPAPRPLKRFRYFFFNRKKCKIEGKYRQGSPHAFLSYCSFPFLLSLYPSRHTQQLSQHPDIWGDSGTVNREKRSVKYGGPGSLRAFLSWHSFPFFFLFLHPTILPNYPSTQTFEEIQVQWTDKEV